MNGKHPLLTLERKVGIARTRPDRYSALRAAAENLSRRTLDAALVELFNEAVMRLTQLVYEEDEGGLSNVDWKTGRLLIPAPWGRAGFARWGLRETEGEDLRHIVMGRQNQDGDGPPGVFLYDRSRRCWLLNLFDFDRAEDACRYWERYPIAVLEYRATRRQRLGG